MPTTSPEAVIRELFSGFNSGSFDAVICHYEPEATFVAQPGQLAVGIAAAGEVVKGFLALKPTLTAEKIVSVGAGDLALVAVQWALKGTGADGKPVSMQGSSADVMRKQADGTWRIVIDNPWGTGILG